MVAALVPTLPVVMVNDENESVVASSPREYWQAVWGGYTVSGPVPPPPRNKVNATLADLDALVRVVTYASEAAAEAGCAANEFGDGDLVVIAGPTP